jgi:hypothetical protein
VYQKEARGSNISEQNHQLPWLSKAHIKTPKRGCTHQNEVEGLVFCCETSIFEISAPKLTKITNDFAYLSKLMISLYWHQNEAACTKTRLQASVFARVTLIFEISAPKLTKITGFPS